jgi:hypothetical protein
VKPVLGISKYTMIQGEIVIPHRLGGLSVSGAALGNIHCMFTIKCLNMFTECSQKNEHNKMLHMEYSARLRAAEEAERFESHFHASFPTITRNMQRELKIFSLLCSADVHNELLLHYMQQHKDTPHPLH